MALCHSFGGSEGLLPQRPRSRVGDALLPSRRPFGGAVYLRATDGSVDTHDRKDDFAADSARSGEHDSTLIKSGPTSAKSGGRKVRYQ